MGLFRPYDPSKKSTTDDTGPAAPEPEVVPPVAGRPAGKGAPTPTRRAAEEARRQRLHPVLTKKEIRQRDTEARRNARIKATDNAEKAPERQLLRDHVDARWNIAEFMLPGMILLLVLSFASTQFPTLYMIVLIVTYVLLAAVIIDLVIMWRGYKKKLAERHPRVSPKGLLMVGVNRAMSIRRFRVPPPRIKRGDSY